MVCGHTGAGISAPWGTTQVCSKAPCQLHAQAVDKANAPPKELLPGPATATWYVGAAILYEGNGNWSLGLVEDAENDVVEWIKPVSWAVLQKTLDDASKRIKVVER